MGDRFDRFRRRPWAGRLVGLAIAMVAAALVAVVVATPDAPADRADSLASRLRCPVCQGVSVAESRSDTALAMQDRIRQLIADGRSDAEVMDWFTDRYGAWVRLDTAGSSLGVLLWVLPPLVFLGGAVVVARRRSVAPPPPVDPVTRARIQQQVVARRRDGEVAPP